MTDDHLFFSGDDVNTVILSGIENCAGILSACLLTMLPIWAYLRHGRAQSPVRDSANFPMFGRYTGPKFSSMKRPLYNNESGTHDVGANTKDGTFQRLEGEFADELDGHQRQCPSPKAITVTTNIETSQKTLSFGRDNKMLGARQPEW